jgi:adenylate cyclase
MGLAMIDACVTEGAEYEVRVGLSRGELTLHHGDYFGPTVNLASRAARSARPNTALVDEGFAAVLDGSRFRTKPIPARRLKGIGSVQLHVLRRARDGEPPD